MKVVNFIRKSNYLSIDIDLKHLKGSKTQKVLILESILHNLMWLYKELYIRESSSMKGFHIVVEVDDTEGLWVRELYDDRKRLGIDMERRKKGIESGRFLWFQKGKRKAGQWVLLKSSQDIERFIREYFIYQF